VQPTDSLEFDLWRAGSVTLYESSYIHVYIRNGRFVPEAMLNGEMSINAGGIGGEDVKIQEIGFENLKLSSYAPYISEGIFSTGSGDSLPELSGFKIDIDRIGLKTLPDSSVALDVEAGIMLSGEKGGAFSAKGGLQLVGEMNNVGNRKKWKYKKTIVKKIELAADNEALGFKGILEYYNNDRTYGNGYFGLVDADFKKVEIKVKASARFGTVNKLKYWYADALASFNKGIKIAPGLGIYGFGGGAYYQMKMKPPEELSGDLMSGISYVPDPEAGLGIRAAVSLKSLDGEAFEGDAAFEISFYKGGGIRNINFKGEGEFMSLPMSDGLGELKANTEIISQFSSNSEQPDDALKKKNSNENEAEVSGHLNINYDFSNKILHGNMEVFVDAAEGMVKGIGTSNRAGWAVMHFAPEDWYIHIGTPSDRLGLKMGVGDINARADGYFMAGTNIPASPPPDANVSRILGGINLDYMRDENALGLGSGFAMGASLNFNTGDLEYWKFYAKFMAGAGFDLMLKNYGSDVSCVGRTGPIGINGWYANGQAYAYFDGNIGIRVDVFGDKRNIDIINLSSAAVLQAKLPNPFWMRGVVGGYFSTLGGLVKGECRFEATIGEECEIQQGSAVSGLEVIADITPAEGEGDVSVFNNPQVVFNMPVNEVFELVDINNIKKSFRIKLDYFRVRTESGNLTGTIEWNSTNDVAVFNAFEILPPESTLKVEAQISFEDREGGNWIPVTSKGNKIIEKKESSFVTGTAPDFIPYENVAYSYPVIEMVNFYPKETSNGYIQLIDGQAYLFEKDEAWIQKGKMISSAGDKEFDFTYNTSAKRVEFTIPDLQNNEIYEWILIKMPIKELAAIDENVVASTKSIGGEDSKSGISITKKQAEGSIEQLQESILFTSQYRTSQFSTFFEKMQAITLNNTLRDMVIAWDVHRLTTKLSTSEHFDQLELAGNKFTEYKSLVKLEADLSNNDYYQNIILPTIYANYPIGGVASIGERDVDDLGLPPVRSVNLSYWGNTGEFGFQENVGLISTGNSYLKYDLPMVYRQDFHDIRKKVVPLYINEPNPLPEQVTALMFYSFPIVREGDYKVKLNYYLPGQRAPNSSFTVTQTLDFN
ncbi:MAG: hypothetical protein ABFS32_02740, partial [Bacteroidota bacterium]